MFHCKDRSEGAERAAQQKAEISRCAPGALGLDHPLAREERLRDEESGDEDPSIASLRKRTGIRDDEEAGEELHRESYYECFHKIVGGSFLLERPAYLPRNAVRLLPCGIPERWPTHIPRLAPCRTPAFDSESRSMLFPAASTDTLVTRHFSRLAAPDAIARVELFYLPVILTTHAAFFLSCLRRASLAFSIASGECRRAGLG